MFVSDEAIEKLAEQFGTPERAEFLLPVSLKEFEMIKSSPGLIPPEGARYIPGG